MATVIEQPCPNCEKVLKIPESAFGKRLKCKYCGETFEVEVEQEEEKPKPKPAAGKVAKPSAVGTSKPGGAVKAKKEPEPPKPPAKPEAKPAPPANTYKFADDDDEGDGGAKPNPLGVLDEGEEVPRCPSCAKELEPPDAIVCVHCGFNNMTRTKAETKKTWAPTGEDWFRHLLPGVLALIGFICLIVFNIVCFVNMNDWMAGTLLEDEPATPEKKAKFYARLNDACVMFIIAASVLPVIKLARFAIIRLIINNQPEEQVKV